MQKTLLASAIEANEIPLTEKLVVINLDFRQWTGTTVFKESDSEIGVNGRLPPKASIRELGSKNIIEPKSLEPFNTIKQRARALLEQNGVALMAEEWIAQNLDFELQLRSAVKSALEVDLRIYARFTAVRIAPVGDNDSHQAEMGCLADRLLKSIAQTANRLLVESWHPL